MSTLAVNSIVDANSGNTTQINGMTPTADSLQGFRNRIINGDMRIAQRGTTASPTSGGYYTVDRFRASGAVARFTETQPVTSQSTDAPAGFTNSFLWTNTNAVSPFTTTQTLAIEYRVEGNNTADLSWGTASAKTVTLSFWVKSSLTGNFGGSFLNSSNNRAYPYTYSISSANTWEYKTVTVEGDTTGTWLADTGVGLRVNFSLGAGPDRRGPAGSWSSTRFEGVTGQVQLVETAGATFQLTGVQLEAGSVATPFERRPFGTELALCQRYFEVALAAASGSGAANNSFGTLSNYKVTKRANPTMTQIVNNALFTQSGVTTTTSSYSGDATGVLVFRTSNASLAQFSERFSASAEL